ncbi:hypothetical protein EV175_004608 [Coemansia sp. RSA 1933]|nr:hypothetical protein EV175_004608 [Coemansia sp. RSA 1933]
MKNVVLLVSAALAAFGSVASAAEEVAPEISPEELAASAAAREKKLVPKSDYVIELDRSTYFDIREKRDEVVIEFYANWCMACHGLASEFDKFAKAAHEKYPKVAITRSDITKVEYLSSSFMVDMLPQLVYLRRPGPGMTPEVRYISANFSSDELIDYLGGGWTADKPSGGYASVWCTPTNFCGHIGGLLGESVVWVDRTLNPFDIPAWAFMAIIVSIAYLLGQLAVGYIAGRVRDRYRKRLQKKDAEKAPRPVGFNEYRSDAPDDNSDSAQRASSSTTATSPKSSASKRTRTKKQSKK